LHSPFSTKRIVSRLTSIFLAKASYSSDSIALEDAVRSWEPMVAQSDENHRVAPHEWHLLAFSALRVPQYLHRTMTILGVE